MRILLIEDEEKVARGVSLLLEDRCGAEVQIAASLEEAISAINKDLDLDLIICDLRIPAQEGGIDVAEDHGIRVHDVARSVLPGVPSVFFSGYANLDNIGSRLSIGLSADLFGTGEQWPLVEQYSKDRQPEFIDWAYELSEGLKSLELVEIQGGDERSLSEHEARTLRIYARQLGGAKLRLSALGGLSGAKVFRTEVIDETDKLLGLVAAKVSTVAEVEDEIHRYNQYVAPALGIGALAHRAGEIVAGSGRFGAVFYRLADSEQRDLFDLLPDVDNQAAAAVARLGEAFSIWHGAAGRVEACVGDLRANRVSESQLTPYLSELDRMRWRDVEGKTLEMAHAVQHCDLHGKNVLVGEDGSPVIIDYGDIDRAPAVLDPVTLELSLLLHEEHPDLRGWPTPEEGRNWFDLEKYLRASPVPKVVGECRRWAKESGSESEIAAMVYAHAVRQLKYPDTDKELALAIAEAAASVLLE